MRGLTPAEKQLLSSLMKDELLPPEQGTDMGPVGNDSFQVLLDLARDGRVELVQESDRIGARTTPQGRLALKVDSLEAQGA